MDRFNVLWPRAYVFASWMTSDSSSSKSTLSYDRHSVGQSVLVSAHNFSFSLKFCLDRCEFVILWRSLWREDRSIITVAAWPRQLSPSRVWVPRDSRPCFIVPIFEILLTSRARSQHLYPPGTGWPSYTPGHWVPFSSPLTTRRATVEVFEPASTRDSFSRT
jgi:hypothetical protein